MVSGYGNGYGMVMAVVMAMVMAAAGNGLLVMALAIPIYRLIFLEPMGNGTLSKNGFKCSENAGFKSLFTHFETLESLRQVLHLQFTVFFLKKRQRSCSTK